LEQGKAPLATGEIIAGKYRVLFVIGEGGMGHVFAAEHVQLGHRVALKVMRPSALASEEAVERFVREGRAAARLQSEHIARVSDVGTLESGVPYMVMEFLEGQDLAHLLQARSKLPIDEAVDYAIQAGEALAEAHRHGIVHRDVKPANLFVTKTLDGAPLVKVLDFGISKASKLLGSEAQQITSTSAMIGSPKYMSPEQMQDSRGVDGRADIWALGAILYEMLAGRRAFDATTLATTCVQILQEDPPPVRASRDEVPPALDAIVMRCLQKDPDDRFASVAEFVEALVPFAPHASAVVARIHRMTSAADIQSLMTPSRTAVAASESASSMAALASGSRRSRADAEAQSAAAAPPMSRGTVLALAGGIAVLVVIAAVGLRGAGGPAVAPEVTTPATQTVQAPAASTTIAAPIVAPTPAASASVVATSATDAGPVAPQAVPSPHARPHSSARSPTAPPGVTDRVLEDRR
jgi:serine/threonine protein kinase